MPNQSRIFYAVHAVAVAPESTTTYTALRGVSSVGVNTNFNFQALFELGMVSLYEQLEMEPNVEITLEKYLDGHPLIYHRATQGSTSATLVGRSSRKCNVILSVHTDTQEAASGNPITQCEMSGFFPSNISYRFMLDGAFMEQVTLVGNDKVWKTSAYNWAANFTPTGVPLAAEGVNFRKNFNMALSRFPTNLPGISASGTNDAAAGVFGSHLQGITTSCSLGRDSLFELGRRGPYFRFANFPIEVTTEISMTAITGDNITAAAEGSGQSYHNIYLATEEGTKVDLGSRNKLMSTSYQGGAAQQGGGNVTTTYSYRNFNDMTVTHPNDPTSALAA